MPAVQKRIRDLERALKRKAQDDPSREALEAKLEALRDEKKQHEQQEKERKLSTKYHQVKFFERKKITRQIHKILNKLKDASKKSAVEKLNSEKTKLEEDLAYVLYYPKDMKYVSLFVENEPNASKTEALRQKARTRALQHYQESKEQGDDRVAHAIDVELHPTHKSKKRSMKKTDSEHNASDASSDSDSDASESESSGSESEGDDSSASDSSTESNKEDDKPILAMKATKPSQATMKSQNKSNLAAPTAVPSTYEPDPFFLEEVTEENNTPIPSSYETKQSRATHQPRFQRQPNLKGMHKQEIRMMQWKQKVKAKSKAGYVAPIVEKSTQKSLPTKQEKFAPKTHAPKRKYDQDHAPVKKAWEEGRGVSAASASDLIRQKQTGIVKIQQGAPSKKIKFDN